MVLGPGNDHIATIADEGNNITFVDLRKGELGSTVSMNDRPKKLAISEDNNWMAAGAENGKVSVWKLQFQGDASVTRADLPSLSGRIRTNSGTEPALKPGVPVRLAILNFEAKGMPQEVGDICLNSLSNSLANFDYITLVERKQIETVLKEQKFQASDLTDEKTSVQIGKLLSADHVLLCSIGKLGTSMILTARILDVETGKVIRGREVMCEECRDQDIYDAVKMLASTIAQ
jgi:TolB-like protein